MNLISDLSYNIDNAVIPLVVTIKEKPSPASSSSIEYSQLPAKYRRMPISQTEIEFINVQVYH